LETAGTNFGFQSPGILKVVGFIPVVGPLVFAIASIWQLVAMVIAIRQALDFTSTWRAVGVAVVGFIPRLPHHDYPVYRVAKELLWQTTGIIFVVGNGGAFSYLFSAIATSVDRRWNIIHRD